MWYGFGKVWSEFASKGMRKKILDINPETDTHTKLEIRKLQLEKELHELKIKNIRAGVPNAL